LLLNIQEQKQHTRGGLIKENLLMHKSGKIISKRKCIQETNYNRFIICGVNKEKQIFSDLIQGACYQ
jgi:hypothetical protein